MRQGDMEFTWENEEGEEVVSTFPTKMEVCDNCQGYGTHLTESIREHAYTMEEFEEAFYEEESREAYFKRGGMYDVTCETCNGNKVVPVIDETRMTEAEKKEYAEYSEWKERRDQADAEYEAECRMERMMGC